MSLADILGGLGGLGEGYLKGTNQLQQLQSQQYANALRQLQMQQLVQGGGAAWGALQQGVNPMNQPGSPVPMMDQTQAGLPAVQQSPLSQAPPNLPQVPDATAQMGATGGGDLLIPNLANKNVNWQGESPQFKQNVSAMLAAMPPDIRQGANVDSAFRSYDEQVPLYQKYLQGGPLAAPPGKSQHQLGNAADWNTSSPQTLAWMQGNKNENVHRFGLDFPLGAKDPDHMQLLKANAINQQIDQSLPPPVKVAAQGPATTVLRSFGNNPMAQIGQHDPSTIVSAIDKANPGAPDFVKFAAFQQLYPLLTNAGKIDFAQAMQMMNYKRTASHQSALESEAKARLRETHEYHQERLAQGAGGAGGEKLAASKMLEFTDKDGNPQQVLLREKKGGAGWVDSFTGKDWSPPAGAKDVKEVTASTAGGGRAGAQVGRQTIAGAEVRADLQNVRDMPVGTTTGLFGNVKPGTTLMGAGSSDLATTLTTEDEINMKQAMSGLGRELSTLMSPVYGGNWASEQLEPLIPKAGYTVNNALYGIARVKQAAQNALEGLQTQPIVSGEQKAYAKKLTADINEAIPWNVKDVIAYQRQQKPKETFGEFAKRSGVQGAATPDGAPPVGTIQNDSAGTPYSFKGGDPSDAKNWEKVTGSP